MNIKSWFLCLWGGATVPAHCVRVGTRVSTPHGIGTVTNGSIQVDLDRPNSKFRVNMTSNINDIKAI